MNPLKGMKLYTVHVHPGKNHPHEEPVLVREGFNIFAFMFHFLWAFYEKLWIPGLAIIAINVALVYVNRGYGLSEMAVAVLQIGYQVILGFHANDWLRARLEKRGYVITDVVSGDSLFAAERRYFERYLASV